MTELELVRKWLTTLMAQLDAEVDESTRARMMEHCGRTCALHHGSIETARAIQSQTGTVDELLDRLNQQEGLWCGKWIRDGNVMYSVCEGCGCPLVGANLVEPSPTFCNCSRGWAKAVFEAILGKPVEVELEQAIGRGDPVCRFVVVGEEWT